MSLRPTDLLLPPELRAILIGAPRAGKSHFVKEVLRELKKMRPMQCYLKVLYACANFHNLNAKDHRFADEIAQVCGNVPVEFTSNLPTLEELQSLPTSDKAKLLLVLDDFG